MASTARAAVLTAVGAPLEIVEIGLPQLGPGQVRVGLVASGVCHTDATVAQGLVPFPPPLILGHEGAGLIEAVADDVTELAVGDHVVLSWVAQCRECFYCQHGQAELCESTPTSLSTPTFDGGSLRTLAGIGTFASSVVVDHLAAIKIPADVPLTSACLIGCAVLTGIGAALNTARIQPGDVVAVIGCGGVGLNVIQGARLAGARSIIAIDQRDEKLALATRFGATYVIKAEQDDQTIASVRALTEGRGADVTIEVVGSVGLIRTALETTRPGGAVCLVGAAPIAAEATLPVYIPFIRQQKRLLGCRAGSADLQRDIPRIIDGYRNGTVLLDELVGNIVPLNEINTVMDHIDHTTVARTVITFR